MTYKTLLSEALSDMPIFKKTYDNLIAKDDIDKDSGMHIIFGYAFAPVLIDAIRDKDIPTIRQMFAFLEKMAGCSDLKVQEVCDQSVIEAVAGEYRDDTITPYMGKKTIEGLSAIREYIEEPEGKS